MPSKSKAQHNFMAAVAHNPTFAKKAGVPQSVGKDFNEADKGRKFSKGGDMKKMNMGGYANGGMPMVNKGGKMVPSFAADGKGKMAKGGMTFNDDREPGSSGGGEGTQVGAPGLPGYDNSSGAGGDKRGGLIKAKKMAMGGMTKADMKQDKGMMQKAVNKHEGRLHKGSTMTKLAKGGSASARGDGIAQRGKTKGTQTAMKRGGVC